MHNNFFGRVREWFTRSRRALWAVLCFYLAASALSLVLSARVRINYDISDYLPADTQTAQAMEMIREEFGMTGSIQVMASDNITVPQAEDIKAELEGIPNVLTVSFDGADSRYYRDGTALFAVLVNGDDYSEAARQVSADIRKVMERRADVPHVDYGGTAIRKQILQESITRQMVMILALSLCMVVVILLITSRSWLEPLILLAASGVAVLINRGTNLIFGEISYITNSIAAILQLALSIDYSIVLLHAYRSRRAEGEVSYPAMRRAIRSVLRPVSASALTTVAGLLALLFMSFRIGYDVGIVLMKGIVISAVTSVTLLPTLVLLFERPMEKTEKRAFVPHGSAFVTVAKRAGTVLVPLALVLAVVCGVVQSSNQYCFSDKSTANSPISKVFGQNNTVVLIWEKSENDSAYEAALAARLADCRRADGTPVLTGTTSYSGIPLIGVLERENSAEELYSALAQELPEGSGLSLSLVRQLYGMTAWDTVKDNAVDFRAMLDHLAALSASPDFAAFIPADTAADLVRLRDGVKQAVETMEAPTDRAALLAFCAESLNLTYTEAQADAIFAGYFAETAGAAGTAGTAEEARETAPLLGLLSYMESHRWIKSNLESAIIRGYRNTYGLICSAPTAAEFPTTLREVVRGLTGSYPKTAISAALAGQAYLSYFLADGRIPDRTIGGWALLAFLTDALQEEDGLGGLLPDGALTILDGALAQLEKAKALFRGERYTRMLLSVDLPNEGADSAAFVKALGAILTDVVGSDARAAGEIISTSDLTSTFSHDNLLISVFTLVSVFAIVLLLFRSLSLPILLVSVIQGAIFIAMAVAGAIEGATGGIFFMSYIVSVCILMGATIDYGILMSSSYQDARREHDRDEALKLAVAAAMPTVFSSGLILSVCGFVIHFLSTQNAISTVGLLLGIGTVSSVLMITFVLPALLYLLDRFVLELSWRR